MVANLRESERGAFEDGLTEPLIPSTVGGIEEEPESAPLIVQYADIENGDEVSNTGNNGSLLNPILNLTCTIIGSGIIALPKSFQVLGVVLGCTIMVGVACLSYLSLAGLIRASIKSNSDTYSRLIRRFFGTTGSNLLKLMMILNCGGILIVYLVMIMDILVGTERDGFMGVIPSLSGVHEAGHLATSRNGILAITLVLILGPVACLREMKSVSITSAVGLSAVIYLVSAVVILFLIALFQGSLSTDWTWLPVVDNLGKDVSDAVMQIVATVPVVMSAYVCHQSVHPVMSQVKPLNQVRMNSVVINSLILSSALYISTAGAAYVLFGQQTKSDVLENFDVNAMDKLLPGWLANFVSYSVRLVFSLALMMSFPLSHFAYRDNLCELILHKQANDLSPPAFYGLTSAGLVVFYFTACTLPNIWLPLAVIGSTAGVTVAFIFPALLMMSMDSQNIIRQVAGAGLFAAGACVSISGLVSTFLPLIKGQHAQ